jgi:hypothetical protein
MASLMSVVAGRGLRPRRRRGWAQVIVTITDSRGKTPAFIIYGNVFSAVRIQIDLTQQIWLQV